MCTALNYPGIGRKMALKFAQMRATVVIWDIFEAGMQQTGSNSRFQSLLFFLSLLVRKCKTCMLHTLVFSILTDLAIYVCQNS